MYIVYYNRIIGISSRMSSECSLNYVYPRRERTHRELSKTKDAINFIKR